MSTTQASRVLCQQSVIRSSTVGKPDGTQSRYQFTDLVSQIAAGQVPDKVYRVAAAHSLSFGALAKVAAHMVDVGAHKGDGWTGYLKHALVKLVGLSERTVRRAVKVLRAIDVLEGAPPPPYQDDDGRWRRDPTTLRLRLPDWARAAHWRKPKPEKPQVEPSGQRWPLIAAPPPVDAYKPRDQDTETPVDSAPPWPRAPLPNDYLEHRAALGSRRGAPDARRRLKKRR